jgi:hypothetical protein
MENKNNLQGESTEDKRNSLDRNSQYECVSELIAVSNGMIKTGIGCLAYLGLRSALGHEVAGITVEGCLSDPSYAQAADFLSSLVGPIFVATGTATRGLAYAVDTLTRPTDSRESEVITG